MAEVSISKNRNGPLKDVKLKFISKFAKFVDHEMEYSPVSPIPANTTFDGSVRTRTVMSKMDDDDHSNVPF